MVSFLLLLHILTGITTLFYCFKGWLNPAKELMTKINLLGFGSVATGSVLSIYAAEEVGAYCAKIGVYVAVLAATQIYLLIKNKSMQFNYRLNILTLVVILVTAVSL